jgi:hypothetical protein
MSAIASVYMIDKGKVEELKKMAGVVPEIRKSLFGKVKETVDPFWEWFQKNTVETASYNGSGFIYPTLIVYLEEKRGVDLMKLEMKDVSDYVSEKRPYLKILITPEEASRLAPKLNPSLFSVEEVMKFFQEFEEKEPPPAVNIIEAIQMLHDSMLKVGPDQIMVFDVG